MENIVDARGYSCPQPVIMTMAEINKTSKGTIAILVDTDTSKENVLRAVSNKGWNVDSIEKEMEGYKITISKTWYLDDRTYEAGLRAPSTSNISDVHKVINIMQYSFIHGRSYETLCAFVGISPTYCESLEVGLDMFDDPGNDKWCLTRFYVPLLRKPQYLDKSKRFGLPSRNPFR
jgi:tRNA 2-thiouridine synthesizing protein A